MPAFTTEKRSTNLKTKSFRENLKKKKHFSGLQDARFSLNKQADIRLTATVSLSSGFTEFNGTAKTTSTPHLQSEAAPVLVQNSIFNEFFDKTFSSDNTLQHPTRKIKNPRQTLNDLAATQNKEITFQQTSQFTNDSTYNCLLEKTDWGLINESSPFQRQFSTPTQNDELLPRHLIWEETTVMSPTEEKKDIGNPTKDNSKSETAGKKSTCINTETKALVRQSLLLNLDANRNQHYGFNHNNAFGNAARNWRLQEASAFMNNHPARNVLKSRIRHQLDKTIRQDKTRGSHAPHLIAR